MNYDSVSKFVAFCVLSTLLWLATSHIATISENIAKMEQGVEDLNLKMAIVVLNQSNFKEKFKKNEEKIDFNDRRIRNLESRK